MLVVVGVDVDGCHRRAGMDKRQSARSELERKNIRNRFDEDGEAVGLVLSHLRLGSRKGT
jgi:hypothetical protein